MKEHLVTSLQGALRPDEINCGIKVILKKNIPLSPTPQNSAVFVAIIETSWISNLKSFFATHGSFYCSKLTFVFQLATSNNNKHNYF